MLVPACYAPAAPCTGTKWHRVTAHALATVRKGVGLPPEAVLQGVAAIWGTWRHTGAVSLKYNIPVVPQVAVCLLVSSTRRVVGRTNARRTVDHVPCMLGALGAKRRLHAGYRYTASLPWARKEGRHRVGQGGGVGPSRADGLMA